MLAVVPPIELVVPAPRPAILAHVVKLFEAPLLWDPLLRHTAALDADDDVVAVGLHA